MEKKRNYIIYRLTCSKTGDMYFGSTSGTIQKRFNEHLNPFNASSSRFLIEPTCDILEILDNVSSKEAHEVERHYIINYPCVNIQVPHRTKKEYENSSVIIKDKIRGSRACECGRTYTQDHKARHFNTMIHMVGTIGK